MLRSWPRGRFRAARAKNDRPSWRDISQEVDWLPTWPDRGVDSNVACTPPALPGGSPSLVGPLSVYGQGPQAHSGVSNFHDPFARTASIPIILWVSAAIVAHLAGGGGAMEAASYIHERDELRALVRSARQGLMPPDTTFELLTADTLPTPNAHVEPPTAEPADKSAEKVDPNEPPDTSVPKHPRPKRPDAKIDAKSKEQPKPTDAPQVPKVAPTAHIPPIPSVPLLPMPVAPAPPPPPPMPGSTTGSP